MTSLQIIYASTSGHTEYVVGILTDALASADVDIADCKAEAATPEIILGRDVLVLASGSWNTGGIEGQLNPYMHDLLTAKVKDIDLGGKPVAIVALGDERYRYLAKAGEHLKDFVVSHGGTLLGEQLTIVNEPFGQEEKIRKWAASLLKKINDQQ